MPTPEHIDALAAEMCGDHEAAMLILDAITRDPAVQDAMLAALAAGGRLVEERRQPCSCGSESVGPLHTGHFLADAHTSLRERARYVTHWREVPDA